jgi:cytochrome oxidase Cu insertion factor (SCO1/SenC/PrrC family)
VRARPRVVLPLVIAVLAGSAAIARADGDPASDFLVARQVFLSTQSTAVSSAQRELLGVVASANRAGFAVRVAVISSEYDVGSITALWRKPHTYARFLGLELAPGYRGRLLVVMPNGFGFNWPGHPSAPADALLARVHVAVGGDGMAQAAQTAVTELAAAGGVTLGASATPGHARPQHRGGSGSVRIAGAALAVLLIALVLAVVRRGRQRRPQAPAGSATSRRAVPRKRWIVPAFASLCVVAIGVPIGALTALRHPSSSIAQRSGSLVTPPPFSWPAGSRPAPGFALRDQHGRPVSVAAFRGRPVIVTFIDPLCRNLCPLEAKVLNDAVSRMPIGQRPVILAVSVDVYADARADLMQDVRKWELVPQWRWAVGRPALLAAVWRNYKVGVQVTTKRIAGTTINYITHTEAAYIIDRTGHERALFLWPFYPQDVEHVLNELA